MSAPDRATTARRAELLMPAGTLSRLKTALLYGADAVYAGTPDLSLRTHSDFPLEDLQEGIRLTHAAGKRIYLTLNLFTHNKDIEKLPRFLEALRDLKPDGVIVADPGVFQFLKDEAPELERHLSTQANISSWLTVDYWKRQGASLCVMAREVSFGELTEIRERCPDIKLETFVHGAICMTYSGRCLLSNYMAERGSNQGSCAHSCRWKYNLRVQAPDGSEGVIEINDQNKSEFQFFLEEEFRRGELYTIEEDDRGSYILNARDLCLMPKLNEYLQLGIDSLKVEGRNKNEYYVAVVARAYRAAIDAYYADPENWDPEPYMAELHTVKARGHTLGFHEGRLTNLSHDYNGGQSLSDFEFAGFIRSWEPDALILEVRNRLSEGDVLEFLPAPGASRALSPAANADGASELPCIRLRAYEYIDAATGERKSKVSAGQGQAVRIPLSHFHAEDHAQLRRALPVGSVARKRMILSADDTQHLATMRAAQQVELGLLPAESLLSAQPRPKQLRPPPRLGAEGCCGLGCNGCLPFWNEPKFARAREKLANASRRLQRAEATQQL
jgi:U32 family peptidase